MPQAPVRVLYLARPQTLTPLQTAEAKTPSRPPSPTDVDVATTSLAWKLFTLPLYTRIAQALYGGDKTLPPQTSGVVGFLKLDGYGARNTTDNMCCLIDFLREHSWDDQLVNTYIDTMRGKPHWPPKLADAVRAVPFIRFVPVRTLMRDDP